MRYTSYLIKKAIDDIEKNMVRSTQVWYVSGWPLVAYEVAATDNAHYVITKSTKPGQYISDGVNHNPAIGFLLV